MKILTQTLLVSSLTAALWLTPAGAETPVTADNSSAAPVNSSARRRLMLLPPRSLPVRR